VVRQSGIPQDASIHPLRHAYATHLFARGVPRRVIQERLGHKRPSTTARYTQLTSPTLDLMHATISALRADLSALRERPCQSEQRSFGVMAVRTWSGLGRICSPAIGGRSKLFSTVARKSWEGTCFSVITVARSMMSTTPVAIAAAQHATARIPRHGGKRGGRHCCRSPTFTSSSRCPTRGGNSSGVTHRTALTFCSARRPDR